MTRDTTRSYAGRQVDIELLRHVGRMLPRQRVTPSVTSDEPNDGAPSSRIVAGIEKAVQRYTKLFLTAVGSVRTDRSIGSDMLHAIGRGDVSDMSTLDVLYTEANDSAMAAMSDDDENQGVFGSIPDDERIVESRLVGMNLDRPSASVRVHVKLITAAGDDFTFVIPVNSGLTV